MSFTEGACLCLVTETVDDLGRRSDESDACLLDLASKFSILG